MALNLTVYVKNVISFYKSKNQVKFRYSELFWRKNLILAYIPL